MNLLRVSVSPNGRFLQRADGSPFFWTADTAWHLLHRSTREEAEQYLQHRRANGFNVIQTVILAERPLSEPNAYGCRSLVGNDPGQPNECYFEHVDWVVQRAGELGLYVALLPTWGDKVNLAWGQGPVIFNSSNAYTYGAFLGARYREAANVLWVLGGDRDVANNTQREIWLKLAQGIVDGVGGDPDQVLIGYHPQGWKRSSTWFQPYPIVKLHAMQSGHASRDIPVWDWIQADYQLTPPRPVLDLEPNYEDISISFKSANGLFTDYDVRRQLYRAVFAGASGVTYGHHSIWQWHRTGEGGWPDTIYTWEEALARPGGLQVSHLHKLMLSRPFFSRIPDQSLLASPAGTKGGHVRATRASDGSYAMVYIPSQQTVSVRMDRLSGPELRAWWYDPRTGAAALIGLFPNVGTQTFTPPATAPDWVLVLDDAQRIADAPGVASGP